MKAPDMKSNGDFTPEELEKMPPCPYVATRGEEACREDENIIWLEMFQEWAYWNLD